MPNLELISKAAKAIADSPASRALAADVLDCILPASKSSTQVDWLQRAQTVENPYLQEATSVMASKRYQQAIDVATYKAAPQTANREWYVNLQRQMRHELTHKYSWAIPNAEALGAIAEQGKILEAGAGSGYWSSLLRKMDVDVVAFDKAGNNLQANFFHNNGIKTWTDIVQGDEQLVSQYPDRSLFLCFPPAEHPFAFNALSKFTGNKFIYVGEDRGGICGDYDFHDLLASQWREIKSVDIPHWQTAGDYVDDKLRIFERNGQ